MAKPYFKIIAPVCHTIGGGRLVGPDLIGVEDRRSPQWLNTFVKSAQSMVDSGDAQAVALFEEYFNLPMPDAPISEQQITEVLLYIQNAEGSSGDEIANPAESEIESLAEVIIDQAAIDQAKQQEIISGQNIFQGVVRLNNGGPACNACHDREQ